MSPVSDLRENLLHLPFRDLTGFDIENTKRQKSQITN